MMSSKPASLLFVQLRRCASMEARHRADAFGKFPQGVAAAFAVEVAAVAAASSGFLFAKVVINVAFPGKERGIAAIAAYAAAVPGAVVDDKRWCPSADVPLHRVVAAQ